MTAQGQIKRKVVDERMEEKIWQEVVRDEELMLSELTKIGLDNMRHVTTEKVPMWIKK